MKKNVRVPKEEVINVRCTKQQKALLDDVAARQGLGLSTWILQAALMTAQAQRGERS